MPIAAVYARYSTDMQRETSIEDQVRRCREIALKEGLTVADEFVFADMAISGTDEGLEKRIGYKRLLDAWDAGLLDAVIADDVCRLARSQFEGAKLQRKIERTGIRVFTGDGIDTSRTGWELIWTLRMLQANQEVKATAHRVTRGMLGQLERGFMIAYPPLGYRAQRVRESGGTEGTCWIIDEEKAAIVRQMYEWRMGGMSVAQIARKLNDAGIQPPRRSRSGGVGYWRPGSVYRLLTNTIYRGVFVWNGSGFIRAKARKARRKLDVREYERPDLRLVDDETWYKCNPPPGKPRARGGRKHLFSGLVRCGDCGAALSIGGGPKSYSLHCPQCEQAVLVGHRATYIGYASVSGARVALLHALRLLFSKPVIEEFHRRLRARLADKPAEELRALGGRLRQLEEARARVLRVARNGEVDEAVLEEELRQIAREHKTLAGQLKRLEFQVQKVSKAEVERQCQIDPLPLLEPLLDAGVPIYQASATLGRLIRSFRLVAKPRRYAARYEIQFVPGALVAHLAQGDTVDETHEKIVVEVQTSPRRPRKWAVTVRREG